DPVRKLSSVLTRIQSGAAAADRIFHFIDLEPRIVANVSGKRLPRHSRDIEFKEICFSYEPGHPILTGAHLKVRHGETIALVGTKLSAGQKQRVTLARAILRDPSILILDEFTSQSDVESEAIIHRFLRDFMQKRTTFVITHRLNTLEIADRIVVLDGGRIVALGAHAELVRTCAVYQRLHEAHSQRLVA